MGKSHDYIRTETAILVLMFCYIQQRIHGEIVKWPDGRIAIILGNVESQLNEQFYKQALDYAIQSIAMAPFIEAMALTVPKDLTERVCREYAKHRASFENKEKTYPGRIKTKDQQSLMKKVWESLSSNAEITAAREQRRKKGTLNKWEKKLSGDAQTYFNDKIKKAKVTTEQRQEILLKKVAEYYQTIGFPKYPVKQNSTM